MFTSNLHFAQVAQGLLVTTIVLWLARIQCICALCPLNLRSTCAHCTQHVNSSTFQPVSTQESWSAQFWPTIYCNRMMHIVMVVPDVQFRRLVFRLSCHNHTSEVQWTRI